MRSRKRILIVALISSTCLLVACQPQSAASADSNVAQTPVEAPKPLPTTPPTTPESTLPKVANSATRESASPNGARDLAKWDGYAAVNFGMSDADVRKAWSGELKGDQPSDGSTCYHLSPAWEKPQARFALMFEGGKFVRYSSENDTLLAPGGGKVGMPRTEIDKLYAGKIEEQPHKYTDGKYLRIKNGSNVLIFETDTADKVTEWRVGVPPQVDYVEGCS